MVRTTRRSHFGAFTALAALALLCVLATSSGAAAGDTTRVSVASDGTEANNPSHLASMSAAISADGRFVTFQSDASNLVPGDSNHEPNGDPASDIFVRDRDADDNGVMDEPNQPGVTRTKTERVSVDSSGNEANGSSAVVSTS